MLTQPGVRGKQTDHAALRLLLISTMHESGGTTTQRLLDRHSELFSYPFESQTGTKHVQDHRSSLYPAPRTTSCTWRAGWTVGGVERRCDAPTVLTPSP